MTLPPPPPPPSVPPSVPPPPPGAGTGTGVGTTCYRHGNRPAFRRCTRCERIACNECLTPGSVGSLCPDCVRAGRPPTAERVRRWNATRGSNSATFVLMAINIAVGVYTLTSPLVTRTIHQGEVRLAMNRFLIDQGEWWRLITSGFTHFGVLHLLMNMLSLYFLGRFVEPALGQARFVALYFASLLAGAAGALLMQPSFGLTAGASGAIFGLLGASAAGLRRRGIPLMQSSIGTMIMLNLVITFTISGISIGGHLGGLLGGAICGWVMLAPSQRRIPKWAVWATPIAVAVVSVVIAFAVSSGTVSGFR